MNLLKRLRNIWRLSEWEIDNHGRVTPVGTDISKIIETPPKMAQIIKRQSPAEKFLKNNVE